MADVGNVPSDIHIRSHHLCETFQLLWGSLEKEESWNSNILSKDVHIIQGHHWFHPVSLQWVLDILISLTPLTALSVLI
jgi:hypothetical protein